MSEREPRRIIVETTGSKGNKSALDIVQNVSVIISAVAIPVVVGWMGLSVQREISKSSISEQKVAREQAAKLEYINLALQILAVPVHEDDPTSDEKQELRAWAVELLNEGSPVKLNDATAKNIETGKSNLPEVLQNAHRRLPEQPIRRPDSESLTIYDTPEGFDNIEWSFVVTQGRFAAHELNLPVEMRDLYTNVYCELKYEDLHGKGSGRFREEASKLWKASQKFPDLDFPDFHPVEQFRRDHEFIYRAFIEARTP